MVNVVLGPSDQWNLFFCEADLNQDGLLNIQDIVLLVNLFYVRHLFYQLTKFLYAFEFEI